MIASLLIELIALGLFCGMVASHEVGRRLALYSRAKDPEGWRTGAATVETAVLGLVGLLLAFTFSSGAEFFSARRHLILEEANAIEMAWSRLDLLPSKSRTLLREKFRAYLDSRIRTYQHVNDATATRTEMAASESLWTSIWNESVTACGTETSPAVPTLVLPALNGMKHVATARRLAQETHYPPAVPALLAVLCLLSGMVAGYSSIPAKHRNWLHMGCLALILSLSFYLIIDFEYPRTGIIRIDFADQLLMDLRRSMD